MELICITCPKGCVLHVETAQGQIVSLSGNSCPRGKNYAENEVLHPVRMVTSTVKVHHGTIQRCPVMTSSPIPKEKMFEVMKAIGATEVQAPVALREVILDDVCHTGVQIVATRTIEKES